MSRICPSMLSSLLGVKLLVERRPDRPAKNINTQNCWSGGEGRQSPADKANRDVVLICRKSNAFPYIRYCIPTWHLMMVGLMFTPWQVDRTGSENKWPPKNIIKRCINGMAIWWIKTAWMSRKTNKQWLCTIDPPDSRDTQYLLISTNWPLGKTSSEHRSN